jgi:hypothetical protein
MNAIFLLHLIVYPLKYFGTPSKKKGKGKNLKSGSHFEKLATLHDQRHS